MIRRGAALAAFALGITACGEAGSATNAPPATTAPATTEAPQQPTTTAPPPTTTAPPPTTLPSTTISPSSTTTAPTTTIPEPEAPVGSFGVTDVAADDVLNVRSGAGAEFEIVAVLPPGTVGVRTTGQAATATDGGTWWEIDLFDVDGTGWVNSSFLTRDVPPCSNEDGTLDAFDVFLVTPEPGDRVSTGFVAAGCSRSFESQFSWTLRTFEGIEVAAGTAFGGGVDGPGRFEFDVRYDGVADRQLATLVLESDLGDGLPAVVGSIPLVLEPSGDGTVESFLDPCASVEGARGGGAILTSPASGRRVRSGFDVSGCGRVFEAFVGVLLTDALGRELALVPATAGNDWAPFSTTVDFEIDEIQVGSLFVFGDDPSDGEGFPPIDTVIPVVLVP